MYMYAYRNITKKAKTTRHEKEKAYMYAAASFCWSYYWVKALGNIDQVVCWLKFVASRSLNYPARMRKGIK